MRNINTNAIRDQIEDLQAPSSFLVAQIMEDLNLHILFPEVENYFPDDMYTLMVFDEGIPDTDDESE